MLKKYKNLLLLELKKEDYNIDKFEIINIEEDIDEITADPFYLKKFDKRIIIKKGIKITLKDTPLYFIFYNSDKSYDIFSVKYTCFVPGFQSFFEHKLNFRGALMKFERWNRTQVNRFLKEQTEPDLLDAFLRLRPSMIYFNTEEENFTVQEKENATQAIENLKKDIKNKIELNATTLDKLNEKLDNINEKLEVLNKPNWIDFANGVIINILTYIITDSIQQQKFMELLKNAFTLFPKLIWR